VDDDDGIRESLGLLLQAHRFEPLLYRSGEEILAEPEAYDFDCVILDLDLPGINGLDVLASIRSEIPKIPVIFMTALQTGQLKQAAQNVDAAAILDKPVRDGKLIEIINTAIGVEGHA